MDGPWDIDPDEEEAMIAEQAEHDAAAADAAAAEYEANEKKRPAPKTFTRSDDETPVEGVEEATSKCFRCGEEVKDLEQAGTYVAGFTDPRIINHPELYDVLIDARRVTTLGVDGAGTVGTNEGDAVVRYLPAAATPPAPRLAADARVVGSTFGRHGRVRVSARASVVRRGAGG